MILHMRKAMSIAGIVTTLALAGNAWANLPERPGDLQADQPWMTWAIAVVLIAGTAVAALKSSKRSHLD